MLSIAGKTDGKRKMVLFGFVSERKKKFRSRIISLVRLTKIVQQRANTMDIHTMGANVPSSELEE